jgi:hypothetical protein
MAVLGSVVLRGEPEKDREPPVTLVHDRTGLAHGEGDHGPERAVGRHQAVDRRRLLDLRVRPEELGPGVVQSERPVGDDADGRDGHRLAEHDQQEPDGTAQQAARPPSPPQTDPDRKQQGQRDEHRDQGHAREAHKVSA